MKTALYDHHLALGAKMVDFCGWKMPLEYVGIISEHKSVRESVGLFDISHMGRILIEGPQAENFLDYLAVNNILSKPDWSATYTALCNQTGGTVDDVIIYRQNQNRFFLVANACNRQKDLDHLIKYSSQYNVRITPLFQNESILALQGPASYPIVEALFSKLKILKAMCFIELPFLNEMIVVSHTGYTGSGGFELFVNNKIVSNLWDRLVKEFKVQPVGLGARDSLRLEMGYALYGHELTDSIAPTESVAAWTVKLNKPSFLGKNSLLKLEQSPKKRHEYGIVMVDPGIARSNYPVFCKEKEIGFVTSGVYSPSLSQGIAIILVNKLLSEGQIVEVQVRQKKLKAQIVRLPFEGNL